MKGLCILIRQAPSMTTIEPFKLNFLKKRKCLFSVVILASCLSIPCLVFKKELVKSGEKYFAYKHLAPFLKREACITSSFLGTLPLPDELQNLPLAESVIHTKKVIIRNAAGSYLNASMIKQGSGYLLFFRQDVPDPVSSSPHCSYIGCVELDANFEQTEKEFQIIDSQSDHSEDPRILKMGEAYYIVYNDMTHPPTDWRTMQLARFNLETKTIDFIEELDPKLSRHEKNWPPFVYEDTLHFEYTIDPHKILKRSQASHLCFLPFPPYQKLYWPSIWGDIRGGTTAQKIGDQYLGFFHSHFKDKRNKKWRWYVMGAYTFEARPPFRLTAISPYPILFDGLYDSPPRKENLHCIFPTGFLCENREGQKLIHVSCGENDNGVKIITLDQEILFTSLVKID